MGVSCWRQRQGCRAMFASPLILSSGASWSKVHYEVGGHLWRLIEYADRMEWPMLSAIVVNKANVAKGNMDPATLKGFVEAARALESSPYDEPYFLLARRTGSLQEKHRFSYDRHLQT
jgi:hypothetical protein